MDLKRLIENRAKNRTNKDNVTLVCKKCGKMFTMTIGELCWHHEVGNIVPNCCDICKAEKKENHNKLQQERKPYIKDNDIHTIRKTQQNQQEIN